MNQNYVKLGEKDKDQKQQCEKYSNLQDMQMTIPQKTDFIAKKYDDKEDLKKFITEIFSDDSLMLSYIYKHSDNYNLDLKNKTNLMSQSIKESKNKIDDFFEDIQRMSRAQEKINKANAMDDYVELIADILTKSVGLEVKRINVKNEKLGIQCILKMRMAPESLMQYASKYQTRVMLKFDENQQANVHLQFSSDSEENDKVKQIKRDVLLVNKLNNNPTDGLKFTSFIQDQPHPTKTYLDRRINLQYVDKLFYKFPFHKNPEIQFILEKVQNNKLNEKVEKLNPQFSNMQQFKFGITDDCPELYKQISQNKRIDIVNRAVKSVLNVDLLLEQDLISEYSALHNYQDLDIIRTQFASNRFAYKFLTEEELTISNFYFGSEIAHYLAFTTHYTKYLFVLAAISLVFYLIDIIIIKDHIFGIQITFINSIITLVIGAFMLNSWNKREREQNYKFDEDEHLLKSDTELSTFNSPYIWNPLKNKIEKAEKISNQGPLFSFACLLVLMVILGKILVQIIEIKFHYKNLQIQDGDVIDNYFALGQGMIATLTIKIFGVIQNFLSFQTSKWENHRYQNKMAENQALKTFLFQQFNCFFLFWYIAFAKPIYSNMKCPMRVIRFINNESVEQESCLEALQSQLSIQAWTFLALNVVELSIPWLKNSQFKQTMKELHLSEESILSMDYKKEPLNNVHDDQLEIILQFSMCWTFGAAYPLVFIISVLNNMFEVRVDLFKYSRFSQRGLTNRNNGIGFWQLVLNGIITLSVISNFGTQILEMQQIGHAQTQKYGVRQALYGMHIFDLHWQFLIQILVQNIMIFFISAVSQLQDEDSHKLERWKTKDELRIEGQKYELAEGPTEHNGVKGDQYGTKLTKMIVNHIEEVEINNEFN